MPSACSPASAGKSQGSALCYILPQGAATSVFTNPGAFAGRRGLEFWVYRGSASSVPGVDVALIADGAGVSCAACSGV